MSSIKLTADTGGGTFELKAPTNGSQQRVLTIPDETATLLTSASSLGKVLNYKSVTKTDTFTTTSSSNYVDITGLSVSITPAANSKILVLGVLQTSNSVAGSRNHFRLYRDSNAIAIGDARSNRARSTFTSETNGGGGEMRNSALVHLDTHGADGSTAVTYKWRAAAIDGNVLQVNMSVADSDSASYGTVPSFLTVVELAPV